MGQLIVSFIVIAPFVESQQGQHMQQMALFRQTTLTLLTAKTNSVPFLLSQEEIDIFAPLAARPFTAQMNKIKTE